MAERTNISSQAKADVTPAANVSMPANEAPETEIRKELLDRLSIQCKLTVGSPDDPMEREADEMADTIMRMPDHAIVQRKCSHCEEEEKLQRKPLASFIQRKETSSGTYASDSVSRQIDASRGGGIQLDSNTLSFMQSRFGADFSNVKIQTGTEAVQMNRELNAKAFTVGSDIYFNEGQYSPGTNDGKRLLAHELTHTVQQGHSLERKVQRHWDPVGNNCTSLPPGLWLRSVVVNQEIPQTVTLNWSDGSNETAICSTGKGQCCASSVDGVACDIASSRNYGSNCTPITTGSGYTITDRYTIYNGWHFWNTFVPQRGIALHQHTTVTGEPLSHGCVRLELETARKIFCGSRQGTTRVQVKGFARPYCSSAQLQAEWLNDIYRAQTIVDGDTTADEIKTIRETRKTLRSAFNTRTEGELDNRMARINPSNIEAEIPHCTSFARMPIPTGSTNEEKRSINEAPQINQFSLGFAKLIIDFSSSLRSTGTLAEALTLATNAGLSLWQAAINRAQNPFTPNIDDRPLYWTRLRMTQDIRSFSPGYNLTSADRQHIIDLFERSSRGHTDIAFSRATTGQKKVLISGFDPFGFNRQIVGRDTNSTILDSNPSGAAVLSLDGKTILGSGGRSAFVQGVLIPVRYRDFDLSMVENLFRPFLDGTTPVSMIMTISQGGGSFQIEQLAGRRRSVSGFADNEGVLSGGSRSNPIVSTGMAAGSEFLKTQLPHSLMSSVPQTSLNTTLTPPLQTAQGGSIAVEGTGGGFLSNEIFYRVRLLQTIIGGRMATIPVGHLHVPTEDEMSRETIRDTIRNIIAAALPGL